MGRDLSRWGANFRVDPGKLVEQAVSRNLRSLRPGSARPGDSAGAGGGFAAVRVADYRNVIDTPAVKRDVAAPFLSVSRCHIWKP